MEQIMNYVKPELIVVAIVLYFCGMALKQTQVVKDKYIPMLLGAGGMYLYYYRMSLKKFGGITGDLAGYFLQMCELIMAACVILVEGVLR